jgi:transposase
MSRQENELFAKRVIHYYENGAGFNKTKVVHHFVEGKCRRSIYKILSRYEATGENQYRPLPGRPSVKSSPKKVRKVEKAFTKSPTLSVRAAARKLKMDKSTVCRIKVHTLGITARTKKKSPKYLPGQEARAKIKLGLYF